MSLSALALTALLTSQPLTSGATPVGELHLRAPRIASQTVKQPRNFWAESSSRPGKAPIFAKRDFVLYPMGANCRSALQKARGPEASQVQPLSKMPSAHLEFAVARLVDGCPVAALMRSDDKIR